MADRVITLKLNIDEFRWLKNRVAEKLEFYSQCKHLNYVEGKALGKSTREKMETAEWGRNLWRLRLWKKLKEHTIGNPVGRTNALNISRNPRSRSIRSGRITLRNPKNRRSRCLQRKNLNRLNLWNARSWTTHLWFSATPIKESAL